MRMSIIYYKALVLSQVNASFREEKDKHKSINNLDHNLVLGP